MSNWNMVLIIQLIKLKATGPLKQSSNFMTLWHTFYCSESIVLLTKKVISKWNITKFYTENMTKQEIKSSKFILYLKWNLEENIMFTDSCIYIYHYSNRVLQGTRLHNECQ